MMFKDRFDLVFSIGGSCVCAIYLNETRLRMASSPFDWISLAPFGERIRTLCARFDGFLDLGNLVLYERADEHHPGHPNDLYRDSSSGYCFVHDFPRQVPAAESFPAVKAKYDRRIGRLLGRLDGGVRACLVWWSPGDPPSDEECVDGIARVRAAFPNSDCKLIVFANDLSTGRRELREHRLSDDCLKIVGPIAPEGSGLVGDRELNLGAFGRIRAGGRLAAGRRRAKFRRALVKFLSLWHFSRSGRVRARKAWEARLGGRGGSA